MTTTTETDSTTDAGTAPIKTVAPLGRELVESTAEQYGACTRPFAVRRIDEHTGERIVVPLPCGATRASVCPSCAKKARRLRIHQAREGWHLAEEPQVETEEPTAHQRAMIGQLSDATDARAQALAAGDDDTAAFLDREIDQAERLLHASGIRGTVRPDDDEQDDEGQRPVRRRSTRRRQDVPDLPRRPVSKSTTGRVFNAPDGRTYRPSTFLTLTLPSYGRVHADGTPVDPAGYDYRRAARDAIHFGALIDRFWQNLRRAVGWNVQYFAAVEPQQRLAMHLHAAVRGTMPRALLRQVAHATYHQVWWPPHDEPVYELDRLPVWDERAESYVDPDSEAPLITWAEAMEATFEADAQPAHVVRFGDRGIDIQGVLGESGQAGKCLGYLVKYLTKDIAECYEPDSTAQQAHADRLAETLRYEPCSEGCPNWLLYGIQPKDARGGMAPGHCLGKAHKPAHLGYSGRRCLVSRKWSGRNLTEHRDQRRQHVLRVLGAVGAKVEKVTADDPHGTRYRWEPVRATDPDQPNRVDLLLRSIAQRRRWGEQYQHAKHQLSATVEEAA